MGEFDWTEGAQAYLEEMARDGLTAGQIGKVLGITRNAVMGRIQRTGVQLMRPAAHPGIRGVRTAPYKRSPVREARSRDVRARILSVAQRLFETVGYEKTKLNDIGDEIGTTAPAIYNYWPNKAALYREVYGHDPVSPELGRELLAELAALKAKPAAPTEHDPSQERRFAEALRDF